MRRVHEWFGSYHPLERMTESSPNGSNHPSARISKSPSCDPMVPGIKEGDILSALVHETGAELGWPDVPALAGSINFGSNFGPGFK